MLNDTVNRLVFLLTLFTSLVWHGMMYYFEAKVELENVCRRQKFVKPITICHIKIYLQIPNLYVIKLIKQMMTCVI